MTPGFHAYDAHPEQENLLNLLGRRKHVSPSFMFTTGRTDTDHPIPPADQGISHRASVVPTC